MLPLLILLITHTSSQLFYSKVQSLSLRLHPHTDIMQGITSAIMNQKLSALSIVTAVGSVYGCWLRLANNSFLSKIDGPLQITSLTGTFDIHMQPHLHIQLANSDGTSIGGHLPSLSQRKDLTMNCPIYTTLELMLLHHRNLIYLRKIDPQTTFHELYISKKRPMI